ILTAHFVQHPDWFDVVVGSNLFGDILSDLGPAIAGSIGLAPGGNINPEKEYPSMFEPVHGSAPDIAGKNVANPIAQIWTGAMMLDHLGHPDAAKAVVGAIEKVVKEGKSLTRDLGGKASTTEAADAAPAPYHQIVDGGAGSADVQAFTTRALAGALLPIALAFALATWVVAGLVDAGVRPAVGAGVVLATALGCWYLWPLRRRRPARA